MKELKKYQAQHITIKDIYKNHYPYPYYDITSNTVPNPYIPKDRLVFNNKRSLTYKQYALICDIYFKYLIQFLLEGLPVKLPYWLGIFQYKKARKERMNKVDFGHYRKTGEIRYHKNRHTLGYIPVFKWYRSYKQCRLTTRQIWTFKQLDSFKKTISKVFLDDGTKINKLINS